MESGQEKSGLYTGRVEIGRGALNVRSSPGGGIIGQIAKGERVCVLADEGEWVKIAFGDETGYAAKRYICFAESTQKPYLVIEDEKGNVFAAEGSIKMRMASGPID